MPDTKISAMSAAAALAGTEVVPAVQAAANVKATVDQIGDRAQSRFGLTKNNATGSAPTVNSDSSAGYAIGSRWLDTSTDIIWVARDVSVGAAVWVAPQVGALSALGAKSTYWMCSPHATPATGIGSGTGIVQDVHFATPFWLSRRTTFDKLGMYIDTAAAGNAKCGIFTTHATNGGPDAYVTGSQVVVSLAATGFASTAFGAPITLDAGAYWFDFILSLSTAAFRGVSGIDVLMASQSGADDTNVVRLTSGSANYTCRLLAGNYTTGMPGVSLAASTPGPSSSGGGCPLVFARYQ